MIAKPKPEKKGKKPKRPVKKVSSRGALISKAHEIMRDIVIARDGHCVCPPPERGHSAVLQAGHIIPSTKSGVRFDLFNVHCQCSACNGRHVHFEYHYVNWFLMKFGMFEHDRLVRDADNTNGLKNYEIAEIIVQFEAIRNKQNINPEWKPYFSQGDVLSGAWRLK